MKRALMSPIGDAEVAKVARLTHLRHGPDHSVTIV